MGGGVTSLKEPRIAAELRARLADGLNDRLNSRPNRAEPDRLAFAMGLILDHAFAVMDALKPTEEEFDSLLRFVTDVGYATDARRQEWVLLADIFGFTDRIASASSAAHPEATPSTLAGPFYRSDAPKLERGANLCRDGKGAPLAVTGRVTSVAGHSVPGAQVDVWHANGAGRYENQDPDGQPEHNLRGRFVTDEQGSFAFRTVRPGGYTLPDDGPVGQLARRLGLSLDRPAHIHFAVTAPGCRRLVTAIFDDSDPAIGCDALFAVRPELIATFRPERGGHALDVALVLDHAVAPSTHEKQEG
jgi:hydroxyquinol 1,2-dioxygenase